MLGRSKVLDYNLDWYDEVDGSTFYEKDLERTLLHRLPVVYPDFIGIPFSLRIQAGTEKSDPDLAMVKNDYSEWYVIEVEMERHGWEGHVEKQVRVFTKGLYEKKRVADYMIKKDLETNGGVARLDHTKLLNMIDMHQPKVMVVANEPVKDWISKVRKYNAFLSVFQIFRGVNGHEIYKIEGDTPFVFRSKSHCEILKGSSNILIVHTPTFIKEKHKENILITFLGKKTKWIRIDDGDKVRLILNGSTHYLQLEKKYILYLSESDEYFLETI